MFRSAADSPESNEKAVLGEVEAFVENIGVLPQVAFREVNEANAELQPEEQTDDRYP